MKKIKLTQGKHTIVDNEDYPYLSRFNWYLSGDGKYAIRDVQNSRKKTVISMQSLLIKNRKGSLIFHKNNKTLDNRKSNLDSAHLKIVIHHRPINKKIGKTSKYKGVCWDKVNKKWRSTIKFNGKVHSLGRYFGEKKAAIVYNQKARELYGELAYQNKI